MTTTASVTMRCGVCHRFLAESPGGGRVHCRDCKADTTYSAAGSQTGVTVKR